MMDLQVLATLQTKTSTLAQERHETAADLTREGLLCLIDARDEGFADRELLIEACEYLMDAIRHNRNEPDAYIGMGYLLWLVGESGEARDYLIEAQQLDPGNADVQTLLEQIRQDALSQTKPHAAPPLAPLADELDYDRLYDTLEARITTEVQRISSLPPQTFATHSERAGVQSLELRYQELSRIQGEILDQLTTVEEEIDGSALRQKLKPFDLLLNRLSTALTQSWQLIQLQEAIAGHGDWLIAGLARFEALNGAQPDDFSHERFEALLADCDALADQLDELEQRGQDVASLVGAYERLVELVAQLQDTLDQA